jgi:hypothetical protein
MQKLPDCARCGGFMPMEAKACPHCGARLSRATRSLKKTLLRALGGGLIAATLSACYGPQPVIRREDLPPPTPPAKDEPPPAKSDQPAPADDKPGAEKHAGPQSGGPDGH